MNFALGETQVLAMDMARRMMRSTAHLTQGSCRDAMSGAGILDLPTDESDDLLTAASISMVLGEFNAPFSLADELTTRDVLVSAGEAVIEPRRVAIGHLTGTSRAVATMLSDRCDRYVVADANGAWWSVARADVTRTSTGHFSPDMPVIRVEWPEGRAVRLGEGLSILVTDLVLHTAELLGVMRHVHARTIEYVKVRRQFDRPIGSFQAIQHRMADGLVDLNAAEALVMYAVWAQGRSTLPLSTRRAWASAAQAFTAETALKVMKDCVQFHGGMAITAEFWIHRWLRRALRLSVYLGGPARHYSSVGELIQNGVVLRPSVGA